MSFFSYIDKKADKLRDKVGIEWEPWPIFIAGVVVLAVAVVLTPGGSVYAVRWAFILAPVWLPFLIVGGAVDMWYIYKRSEFIAGQKYFFLEMKPPREVIRTPLAMESFLTTLHLTGGESTWWARLMGGVRPYWSLEIASLEGQIHFYIWGRQGMRRNVESQLYAQYPGIQLVDAVDYSRTISANEDEGWIVWGCEYKELEKSPYPIKTYIEYGLDKVQKEPEQTDPLAHILEFIGSIGQGEYLWLQCGIRAHKGEKYKKKKPDGKEYTWIDEGKEIVEEIRKKSRGEDYVDPVTGKKSPGFPNPTKGESEKMAAIERNIGKLAFDVVIRTIYVSRKEKFNAGTIAQIIALYKPFTTAGWNGIDSTGWLKNFADYPWDALWTDRKKAIYRREIVEAFRRRQFFHHPFYEGAPKRDKIMVMSSEELATIYHVPSRAIGTPGIGRIASNTAEAPVNLPI